MSTFDYFEEVHVVLMILLFRHNLLKNWLNKKGCESETLLTKSS